MKRLFACFLMTIMLISLLPVSGLAQTLREQVPAFAGGDGSKENPYLVSTPEQLDAVRNNLSAYYLQINDIDLSDWGSWEPIGTGLSMEISFVPTQDPQPFTGGYDGGNYQIIGLRISDEEASVYYDCLGLFASTENAKLKNIHLQDADLYAYRGDDDYEMMLDNCGWAQLCIGGISGSSKNSTFENCSFDGQIRVAEGCNTNAGGIVGVGSSDDLLDCVNYGQIDIHANRPYRSDRSSDAAAGGIIGRAVHCDIKRCANTASVWAVVGGIGQVGGICGYMHEGVLSNCANYAPVRAEVDMSVDYADSYCAYAGGIAGYLCVGSSNYEYNHDKYIRVEYCVNYGDVRSQTKGKSGTGKCYAYAGGIFGCGDSIGENTYSDMVVFYNLAASICAQTVNADNQIEYLPYCGTIGGDVDGLRLSGCYTKESTLVNGVLCDEGTTGGDYSGYEDGVVNGAKLTAEQLLQQSTYSSFDFQDVWTMDMEVGGAVLQTLDKVQVPQLAIEVSSVKLVENIVDNPIKGIYQYEIRAQFHNTSKTEIKDMVAELSVYDGLSLASGERPEFVLADLPADGVTWATWIVNASWPEDDVNVQFKVSVTVGDAVRVEKDGILALSPPLTYTDIHGWPLLNWTHSFGYPNDEYRIPSERYYDTYGIELTTIFTVGLKEIGDDWSGSCFGLSVLSLAYYYGKIDLAPYFNVTGQTLNEFGYEGIYTNKNGESCYTVEGNQAAIELIERAHISQHSVELQDVEIFKSDDNFVDLIDFLNSEEAHPIMVCTPDHAMVITTDHRPCLETSGDWKGWYILPLYDPNAPTVGDELPNPMSYYDRGRSFLLLNIETSEWAYYCNEEVKWYESYYCPLYPMRALHFYDIAALDPSYFNSTLNLFYTHFKIQVGGWNAKIEDAEGNVLFAMEDGQIVQLSEKCTLETVKGAADGAAPVYTVCTDVANLQIVSDDATVLVMQEETLHLLDMDGSYTVSLSSKNGALKINSQQTSGEFVVYSQDWDGHGAKITGQHRKGNCVTIRQDGAEIRVTTVDADANIAYECENIAEEDMTVALASKKDDKEPDEGMFDFENVIWIVGTVILVAAVVGVAWILVRRNKKKDNAPEDTEKTV